MKIDIDFSHIWLFSELGTEPEPNPEPRFLRRTEPELEPKNLEPEPNRNPKNWKEPNPKEPGFFWVLPNWIVSWIFTDF